MMPTSMQIPKSYQTEGCRDRERRNSAGETASRYLPERITLPMRRAYGGSNRLTVLGPLVLATDLLLLLGGEVVLDVERLADLIGRLALDHVRDGLTADIEESFDVEVVGRLWVC
jgi:hypothetical protein